MSMSTADRQMIQLAIVFVCLISSSFEAKTKRGPQLRIETPYADCGPAENKALNETNGCVLDKWPDVASLLNTIMIGGLIPGLPPATSSPNAPKALCCYQMNIVCATANYMRDKCSPKSDFEQKVKDDRNAAMTDCTKAGFTWSESLCNFGKAITDPKCQQYKRYLDCKDISGGGSPMNPSGNQPQVQPNNPAGGPSGNLPADSKPPVNPPKDAEKSSGLSLRYPTVTELLLVALLIKYFI